VSDVEVARGRHSETEEVLSVTVDPDGHLRATRCSADDGLTFIGDLPRRACDPAMVGRWRHFKGAEYRFYAVVRHGLDAPLVLYCDTTGRAWLRPQHMVTETVVRDGHSLARFVRVDG
jgi:hypothetical protein